ncbi:MAG: hypothetical protein RR620_08895 [Clostridium sp.]
MKINLNNKGLNGEIFDGQMVLITDIYYNPIRYFYIDNDKYIAEYDGFKGVDVISVLEDNDCDPFGEDLKILLGNVSAKEFELTVDYTDALKELF